MTLRLFFHSDDLKANVEVLDCTPHEHEFAVILRATLFHPQGGGQPCDTGWIGESQVLRVVQDTDQIIHYVSHPVKLGMTQIRIDEQRRQFNTRMHSAGHLIGHFVQALGWTPIKAHHWPEEGRVQFQPGDSAQAVELQPLQQGIEKWISHDLPRLTSLREGAREIGFGELPAYGCGGTHVRSLKDLGSITIASLSQKKGTLSVHYSVD
ncbi:MULTISPECIES: alanyl-tRNA editing protein [unclassified Pseudomonas]|uniref:alanyl-tRNA editing protein n=1 Tax=unclassified Pseudomonas TaxID=196821 RepID=UPI002AC97D3F|nr:MULTISPECIES: alanyl-tRNA editing protein [unclassified Pseudomonas]MEB0048737.1 alanyl-tRNA editing protein [Pseudomonas sp. Dout3]MEB0098757.1 alanyl-tRNA editing protein [Pseudomonas sp. DC1.2]WPX57511.1 alanyl-tRNA editing protein [Pseudomonas sp. DC1.2]